MAAAAGGHKRRSWGENQSSRVVVPTASKMQAANTPGQENQVQVQEQEERRGQKVEDSIDSLIA